MTAAIKSLAGTDCPSHAGVDDESRAPSMLSPELPGPVPFLWVCGGGFTATPILIHGQHGCHTHIACVFNRAYVVSELGELLQWNIFALSDEKQSPSSSSSSWQPSTSPAPFAVPQPLNHAEFTAIPLPNTHNVCSMAANKRHIVLLDESNGLWSMPYDVPGYWRSIQVPFPSPMKINRVACGATYALALTGCGRLWSWGDSSPCLGRPSATGSVPGLVAGFPDPITEIVCGSSHSCAITITGELYSWGINNQGCVGAGDEPQYDSPVRIEFPGQDIISLQQAACGYNHTLALTTTGHLYSWGSNMRGQCAISQISSSVPTRVASCPITISYIASGAFHSAIVSENGDLYTFGLNDSGQLGLGDCVTRNLPTLVDCLSGKRVFAVFCGGLVTIALTERLINYGYADDHFADEELGSCAVQGSNDFSPVLFQEDLSRENQDQQGATFETAHDRISSIFRLDVPAEGPINVRPAPDVGHMKEVQRISQMYREKLVKENHNHAMLQWKASTILQQADRDREKYMEAQRLRVEAVEATVNIWVHELLPEFSKKRNSKKCLDLLYRTGIPPRLRSVVWSRAIANGLLINTELFSVFSSRAQRIHDQIVARGQQNGSSALAVGRESTIYYIEVDLPRTFPTLAFFRRGQPLHSELRNLLQTYCCYRPDVGYVQGMSYLAGSLLLYLDPYMAFTLLANLLMLPFLHAFVRMDTAAITAQYAIHSALMQAALPKLYQHFSDAVLGISPQLYALEWFITLFSKRLNLNCAARAWDLIFTATPHDVVIHKIGIGILSCLQDRLLQEPFDGCMRILNKEVQEISGDALMTAVASIRVPRTISTLFDRATIHS